MPAKKFKNPTKITFYVERQTKEDVEVILGKVQITMSEFLNKCLKMASDGRLILRPAHSARIEVPKEQ